MMPAKIHAFKPEKGDGGPEGSQPRGQEPADLDPRIREVLIRLPRIEAGEHFTARVLEQTGASRSSHGRLRSLAAAAAFFAFGAIGAHQWNESQAQRAAEERLTSLHLEYQMLQEELLELERAADESRQVVYLGGQGDVEYVIDLSRLASKRQGGEIRHASTSSL